MKRLLLMRVAMIAFLASGSQRAVAANKNVDKAIPKIPKGYKQIECTLTPMAQGTPRSTHLNLTTSLQTPEQKVKGVTQRYSYAWSGYVATTAWMDPESNAASAVAGTWVVPTIQPSTQDSYCVIWVGIDGYYHTSKTVEQIGTGHCWIKGAVMNYAWFEMYPDSQACVITGFPVDVGDMMTATVNYISDNVFLMRIYNNTKKVVFTIPTKYTTSSVTTKRSSAEWIIEAPSSYNLLPLANFGTVTMRNCKTTIKGVSGYLTNPAWLSGKIKMIDGGGTVKAEASDALVGSAFTVTWKRQ